MPTKKAKSSKTPKPYKTAAQLGILPVEREALIAFVKAPSLGQNIALNGHVHYYDQSIPEDFDLADNNHCGTAGCVAGYVFHYANIVAKVKKLRGTKTADDYIDAVCHTEKEDPKDEWLAEIPNPEHQPLLAELYGQGDHKKIEQAKKAVDYLLRNGKVPRNWVLFDS